MSEVFFLLFLRVIRCLSGDLLDTLDPCPYIPKILALSFLISISFGFYFLVLLSEKLADEIDFDLSSVFTVSSVLVLWLYLDLYYYLNLSYDPPLSDLFLMDLYFLLLDACGLSILLTVSILFLQWYE